MIDTFEGLTNSCGIKASFVVKRPAGHLAAELKKREWPYKSVYFTYWSDIGLNTELINRLVAARYNKKATAKIKKIIQKEQPDIVMTNSVIAPWAALAANEASIPHVWFVREYGDLDHGHTFEIGKERTFYDVGKLSSLVVANSKALESHLSGFIDQEKLTTLYIPFDMERIQARAATRVESPYSRQESLKIITTNNIAFSKGQHNVVEAAGVLREKGYDTELAMMGGGNNECIEEIKRIITKYGIQDSVHFIGQQEDSLPYINHADLGVMASKKEAFGRATFECMALGKPVVGSNSGATPELVEDGKNGYLFEPENPKDLASKIGNYINDRALLSEHGRYARKKAKNIINGDYGIDVLCHKIQYIKEKHSSVTPSGDLNIYKKWQKYEKQYLEEAKKSKKTVIDYRIKLVIQFLKVTCFNLMTLFKNLKKGGQE